MGVLTSAALSFLGLILWGSRGFNSLTDDWTGIVYLAVAILIATPIFRVAVSSVYFAVEKDKEYVGITILVLAMLILALIAGLGA